MRRTLALLRISSIVTMLMVVAGILLRDSNYVLIIRCIIQVTRL
jgi:hypothetical protein